MEKREFMQVAMLAKGQRVAIVSGRMEWGGDSGGKPMEEKEKGNW